MCARVNYICKKCGQCVPKAEREQHDEEECGKPVVDNDDQNNGQGNVSSDDDAVNKTTGASSNGTTTQKNNEEEKDHQGEGSSLVDSGNAVMIDDNEANEREIQRLLQEDMNMWDAHGFQDQANEQDQNLPMSNYEKSKQKTAQLRQEYGDDPDMWPEGVRPADQAKEQ